MHACCATSHDLGIRIGLDLKRLTPDTFIGVFSVSCRVKTKKCFNHCITHNLYNEQYCLPQTQFGLTPRTCKECVGIDIAACRFMGKYPPSLVTVRQSHSQNLPLPNIPVGQNNVQKPGQIKSVFINSHATKTYLNGFLVSLKPDLHMHKHEDLIERREC